MKKNVYLLLIICSFLSSNSFAELADTDKRVDQIVVDEFKEYAKALDDTIKVIDREVAKQFSALMEDIISCNYEKEKYTKILKEEMLSAEKMMKMRFTDARIAPLKRIARRAKANGDNVFGANIQSLIKQTSTNVNKAQMYASYLVRKEGSKNVDISMDVFQMEKEQLLTYIIDNFELLKKIDMENDNLGDFLTSQSVSIYNKIKLGKKGYGFFSSKKKKTIALTLTKISKGNTFNVKKSLRKGIKKYPKESSLALLYAYVLLIEKSNKNSLQDGYNYLDNAFKELETEQLAYNLIRVGARLKKIHGQLLKDLVDHVEHRDGQGGLQNIFNLGMYIYIKPGQYDKALDFYNHVKKKNSKKIAGVFKLIVLLKAGLYEEASREACSKDVKLVYQDYIENR